MQNMTNLDVTVDCFTRRTQDSANPTKSSGPSDFVEICRSKGSGRGAIGPASRAPARAGAEQRHPGWLAQTGERVMRGQHGRV